MIPSSRPTMNNVGMVKRRTHRFEAGTLQKSVVGRPAHHILEQVQDGFRKPGWTIICGFQKAFRRSRKPGEHGAPCRRILDKAEAGDHQRRYRVRHLPCNFGGDQRSGGAPDQNQRRLRGRIDGFANGAHLCRVIRHDVFGMRKAESEKIQGKRRIFPAQRLQYRSPRTGGVPQTWQQDPLRRRAGNLQCVNLRVTGHRQPALANSGRLKDAKGLEQGTLCLAFTDGSAV